MNTHTPAPWVLKKAHNARVDLINTKKGEAIGEIVFADVRNPADARLIAAAPELLDALRWALDQIDDDLDLDHRAAMNAARAAIAKATGETP